MTFEIRILAIFIFISIMLLWDLRNPPEKRLRLKIYSFLLITGAIGMIFGMAVDTITSRISPDYFIYGKGISIGPMWNCRVLMVGAQAGFSGAVFAGCCFFIANSFRKNVENFYLLIPVPLLISITVGALLGVFQYMTNGIVLDQVTLLLGPDRARLFTTVWMTHIGIYLGAVVGLIGACVRIRKQSLSSI